MKPALCIRFAGDNDFTHVVEAFTRIVAPLWFDEERPLTREMIAYTFNKMMYSLYCLHNLDYDADGDPRNLEGYLRGPTILVGEEIQQFHNWNGDGCIASKQGETIVYYQA